MATDVERLTVSIEATTAKFEKALARIEGKTSQSTKRVEKAFAAMQGRINASMAVVGGKLLAITGVGLGAGEIISYADTWTRANNALKVAGLSGAELTRTMDALFAAAQRQGAPLEAMTTLFSRAAQSAKELGATQPELVQFSEDVAMALRVAGTSSDEAGGALLQLAQLLGSSRVQAEEFNSVNEAARPILQAVANGIEDAAGSVSKLKALVSDGKVSNVAFFRGFQAGVQTIRDQAETAEPTISQAMTRVQNAFTKLIGEVDRSNGLSRQFVEEMSLIADGANSAIGPITLLIDTLKALNDLQGFMSKNGLNLGKKFNQFLFGTDTVEDFLWPAPPSTAGMPDMPLPPTRPADTSGMPDTPLPPARPKIDITGKRIRLADFPVVGGDKKGGAAASHPDDYAREIKQTKERTEALRLEAELVGKSAYEADKARTAQELLNAAKDAGRAITPELTAQVAAEAEAHARATQKLEEAQEAYQRLQQVQGEMASAFSGVVSAIAKGEDAVDALTSSLERMGDMLMDMISQQLFKQLFAGIPGLNFGSLGTVGSTTGATFVGAATGGRIAGPGSGTSDSIPAMLSNGEYVVNAAMARRYGALLDMINSGRLLHLAGGGRASGGGAPAAGGMGGVNVQVVTNAPLSSVTATRGRDGTVRIDAQIDEAVARALSQPGSKSQRTMRGVYGARPLLAGR